MLEVSYFILYTASIFSICLLIRGFYKGKTNAYFFIIPIFMIFYILPDLVDFLIGYKFTGVRYGYNLYDSLTSIKTAIFYNLYITFVLLFFTYLQSRSTRKIINPLQDSTQLVLLYYRKYKYIYWLILFSPILLVIITGSFGYYSSYLTRNRANSPELHLYITSLIVIGHFLAATLITRYIILMRLKQSIQYLIPLILVLFIVFLNSYIHGKRSIVVLFLMMQLVTLFITKAISRKNIAYVVMLMTLFFIFFLNIYEKNISDTLIETIKTTRIDFSRDFTLKFVIHNELMNDNSVLPFKGASYLFLLLFFIPRSIYPEKPYPYSVYLTNSILGKFGDDNLYGWGFTSSFAAESISNFGWLGLMFFPLFYYLVISYTQKYNSIILHLIMYLVMVLLLLIHPVAIMPLLIPLVFLLIKGDKKFVFKNFH